MLPTPSIIDWNLLKVTIFVGPTTYSMSLSPDFVILNKF